MNHQLHQQIQLLHLFDNGDPTQGRDRQVQREQLWLVRPSQDHSPRAVHRCKRRLAQMPDLDLAQEEAGRSAMLSE